MKVSTALFSLIGLWFFTSCRQKPSLKTSTTNNTLLWEVTGNNLSRPSYFLGTMHLMCAEDAVLTTATKSIIKYVHNIYLEVDLDNAGELLSGVFATVNNRPEVLSDVISPEAYERVKTFFELHQPNISFSVLEKQHPLMLSSSLYEMFLACEQKNGVEMVIVQEAYKYKKEIKGLESVEFQLSVFDRIPYREQAQELVNTIDSIEKHKALLTEMVQVYREQDIEKLYELTTREQAGTAGYLDILLNQRNKNWVQQFDTIASKQPTLFAVGAAHLGGRQGVLQLLKDKGYSLRPILN